MRVMNIMKLNSKSENYFWKIFNKNKKKVLIKIYVFNFRLY